MCELFLQDESQTLQFAASIAQVIEPSAVIYLLGELGAGKTCFARGFIQALGQQTTTVKSPTYTLVEEYSLSHHRVYHFDLYRLADPEELEFIGIRDYTQTDAILLIEWPSRGEGFIPAADLLVDIKYLDSARQVQMVANSISGKQIVEKAKQLQIFQAFLQSK